MTFRRGLLLFLLGCVATPVAGAAINALPSADAPIRRLLRPDTAGSADTIVVLGAALVEGCTPNVNGVRRVLRAVELYREGRADRIFISGGLARSERTCAVSEGMAQLAEFVGVPRDRILTETESRSTWENALFSTPHLRAIGAERLLLVTDRLHMVRAEAAFQRFGFVTERASVSMYESYRDNVEMLFQGFRERVAIAYYMRRGWIADPFASEQAPSMHHHASASVQPPPTPVTNPAGPLVVLGASYAAEWPLAEVAGVPIVNRGVGGEQSFEFLARFAQDVVAARPRAVLVWGFTNDVFRSPRASIDQAIVRGKESYTAMVAQARAAGIEPILMTEITIGEPNSLVERVRSTVGRLLGRPSYQDYINGHVLAMNAWLRDLARREGVLLIDVQPAFAAPGGLRLREYTADDGSHVSPAGYEALTRYVRPILEAHFQAR